MPKISFNISKIVTLPFSKKGTIDYSAKKYPSLILRVGKRSKTFYFRVHKATAELTKGMHFVADVTDVVHLDDVVFPRYRELKEKLNVSKKLTDGFITVRMGDYLNAQYSVDRKDLNIPVSANTIENLKRYFSHCLHKRCTELSDSDYSKFIERWPNNGESSRRKIYYSFNAMLNTLVKFERLSENPLKKRKFNNNIKATINTHDVSYSHLFSTILDDDFGKRTKYSRGFSNSIKLIVCLAIHVGARPSEIRLLKIDDIDLTKSKEALDFKADTVKTLKPRKVPITSKQLIVFLKKFLNQEHVKNTENYVFYNKSTNAPFAMGCWNALYREVKKEFKLKGRFYDFRHTFASKLYKQTGDIKIVADILGDDIATASKYYANDIIDTAREKIKLLD